MARTRNPTIVLGPDGKPLAGAKIHTTIRSSGVDASVYAGETGATPGENPATTDAKGMIVQWLERGAYSSTITAEGMEPYVEPWDSAPASDGAIDPVWLSSELKDGEAGHTATRKLGHGSGEALPGNDPRIVNTGLQDILQAGVVASTDWSFTANIVGGTGALGSTGATGGVAWLPDPVTSGALLRSVSTSAVISGLIPASLPTSGKYRNIGFELTANEWGGGATVSVKAGAEKSSQAEAEAAPPAIAGGKSKIRNVVVKNTASVYSIVAQFDTRPWATGGEVAKETAAQGKVGTETITDSQIIKGRGLVATENAYGALTERASGSENEPSPSRLGFVLLTSGGNTITAVNMGGKPITEPGTTFKSLPFFCPPKTKWQAITEGGLPLWSAYLLL